MTNHLPAGAKKVRLYGSDAYYWTFHQGQPQTIIMIHGFSGNHGGLIEIINTLPHYHIIAPDLPGFGDSAPFVGRPHTVAAYAAWLGDFIRHLKLPQPPVLLGHSLGSVVAARLAAEQPQLMANKLILISPTSTPPIPTRSLRHTAARLSELHYWLGLRLPKFLGSRLLHSHTISRLATFALLKTADKNMRRRIYRHHLQDLGFLTPTNARAFYDIYRALNRDGIITYAPEVHQPTLLIAGQGDRLWPPKTQEKIAAAFPQARLVQLPRVGHLTHFEASDRIGELIEDFLASE